MVAILEDNSGPGVRVSIADGEHLFVGMGVSVSSSNEIAITSTGNPSNDHVANIGGDVSGFKGGIILGNNENEHGQTLMIWKGGQVRGLTSNGALLEGSHSMVNNAGLIHGGGVGLNMVSGVGEGSSVENSGRIEGGLYGIYSNNGSGHSLTVSNSGTITAATSSFREGGISPDKLVNTGAMIGHIELGGGNDTYDGRLGHVKGTVFGHSGNDKLLGGTEDNSFSGGFGNDRLFGGKGEDTFIFDSNLGAKSNVDTITDFRPGEDSFQLDHKIFADLILGKLSDGAFHIGTKATDADNRILYDQKHGNVYYDHDGKGGEKAVLFAHLEDSHGKHAALTHADIFVV